ncbi:LysR family transcriptional regulator [Paenibacillus elgii]|uniref:LysR family transcriptional regulator n=1 Tax=Paenibacillus elgii TaxID=189691 RepID=UPI00203D6E30|nr:LysR family transcriptional regulator [Paenibacillus elgii]MCM3271774.1 LysR family transcriptional regulator [Paenibacillus elgii]
MNTEWLHSFAEAAKLKSFSKASKELNLSQPALSKHIRNLEHDLDATLFYRTSGGIELTEAGERLYENCSGYFRSGFDSPGAATISADGSLGDGQSSQSGYLLPAFKNKSLTTLSYVNDSKHIRGPFTIVEGRKT